MMRRRARPERGVSCWLAAVALFSACGGASVREDERATASAPDLRIGIPSEVRATLDAHRASSEGDGEPTSEAASASAPEADSASAPEPASASDSDSAPEPASAAAPEPEPESPSEPEPSTAIVAATYMADARRHVAHTYRDQIQACFDAAYARDRALSGRVVVAMVPHDDGRIATSRVVANETRDAEVGECVVLAARGWHLPPPPRRTLEVQLRFTI